MNSIHSIEEITEPTVCIIHFRPEEKRPLTRQVFHQVTIDPYQTSPSGDYIRFEQFDSNGNTVSEVHGWVDIDDIVIDEVLQTVAQAKKLEEESKPRESVQESMDKAKAFGKKDIGEKTMLEIRNEKMSG